VKKLGTPFQYRIAKYNKTTRKRRQVARVLSVLFRYTCDKLVAEQEALAKELGSDL
jgi:hypothetical protein